MGSGKDGLGIRYLKTFRRYKMRSSFCFKGV